MAVHSFIAAICSPQEAVALARIQANYNLVKIFIFLFKEQNNSDYSSLTHDILREFYQGEIVFISAYELAFRRPFVVRSFYGLFYNYFTLRKAKAECAHHIAVDNNYLIGSFHIPLLLMFRSREKIIVLDHTPADARARLLAFRGLEQRNIRNKFSTNWLPNALIQYLAFCASSIPLFIYKKLGNFLFPIRESLKVYNKAFVWFGSIPGTEIINYPELSKHFFTRTSPLKNASTVLRASRTLLMVDHPCAFHLLPNLYNEFSQLNLEREYANMIARHVRIDSSVIIKLHPYALSSMPEEELYRFKGKLDSEIMHIGYDKPIYFDEIIIEKYSRYPLELFLDILGVNTVVGIYSSTHVLSAHWPHIRFVSDCSFIPTLAALRSRDDLVFCHEFDQF